MYAGAVLRGALHSRNCRDRGRDNPRLVHLNQRGPVGRNQKRPTIAALWEPVPVHGTIGLPVSQRDGLAQRHPGPIPHEEGRGILGVPVLRSPLATVGAEALFSRIPTQTKSSRLRKNVSLVVQRSYLVGDQRRAVGQCTYGAPSQAFGPGGEAPP